MTIEKISDSLERIFKTFINEVNPSIFFVHLGDYVNYVSETPQLKALIDDEMEKREKEYEKEANLEEKSIKELRGVKSELLKIVKEKNISPDKLQGEWSIFPVENGTILDELELFERGKIKGAYYSSQLSRYLYEIAVGILKQGHEEQLQKFKDPDPHVRNIYGNFNFSETLKKREEQTERIEVARQFEPWGCFEWLIRFQKAFFEASRNSNYLDVFNKYHKGKYRISDQDAAKITHMSEELKEMLRKQRQGQKLSIRYLEVESYKNFVKRAHNYLLNELTKANTQNNLNSLKSIHLVSESLEPKNIIWLVMDELFSMPIRFAVWNDKGNLTAIKKLYDLAYIVNVPNKKVNYNRAVADDINNGLFKKSQVAQYMKTNGFKKPTLVQKSERDVLVLKNEIPVKTILLKNIPFQYQSLYQDKTM